jgi:LPXTG-motif cell wall-anchored protein
MMALGAPAYAATGDYVVGGENTIYAENVGEGDTVYYYKVIEWVEGVEGNGWKVTDAFKNVEGLTVDAVTNGITDELAAKIAAAAPESTNNIMTQSDDPKTTYYATVTPGMYYLKAVPSAEKPDVVYNPAFVSADYSKDGNTVSFTDTIGDTAVLKKSTITFDKQVTGDDKYQDTKPGDVIPYQIKTQIPSYGDTFTDPTFSISDTFSTGLELEIDADNPFVVTYGENSTSVTNDDVTITGAEDGSSNFTVAFKNTYLTGLAGAQPTVTITYSGVVTTEAENNVTYMNNKAVLTYSNTPTSTDSKDDITRHYTFTIDGNLLGGTNEVTDELIKIGVDKDGNPITETTTKYHKTDVSPLAGATFKLTPVDPTPGVAQTFESIDGGYIIFRGLDAGTYTLEETAAPTGFIKDGRIFTVTITPKWNDTTKDLLDSYEVKFTYTDDNGEKQSTTASFSMTNSGEKIIETTGSGMPTAGQFVNNTRGVELPSTGGIGTTIFYVVGAILVVGAGITLVTRRRMNLEK